MTASLRGIVCRAFVAALLFGAAARPASAGWVTFDFNSVNLSGSTATAQNNNVDAYMDSVLAANATGMTVTVTGAKPTNSYTGDGHVVGPVVSRDVKPLTLGTTDGGDPTSQHSGVDTFIDTENSTEIDMLFSGGKIYGISFDYEIFPNATCQVSNCSSVPDFTFKADGATMLFAQAKNVSDLAYHTSDDSGRWGYETSMQLGPKSVSYTFTNGVSNLQFIDWPVVIGIDNLKIDTTKPFTPVPEPATLVLLGSGLAAAYAKKRRQRNGAPLA
jgi:hypothetical protein